MRHMQIREALAMSHTSLKAAAIDMQIDQSQLVRELTSGRLSVARVEQLSDPALRWLAVLLARQVGIPREIATGQKLRVARARLHRLESKRRSA